MAAFLRRASISIGTRCSCIDIMNPSILPFNFMSSRGIASKLFIGGLSFYTSTDTLTEAFSKFGQVVEARIVIDRVSNRPKGFGFVTFASEDEAQNALEQMNGKVLNGRVIFVDVAKAKLLSYAFPISRGRPCISKTPFSKNYKYCIRKIITPFLFPSYSRSEILKREMEKADTLVLLPICAIGHLIPMVELAKRLHHHGLPIRILILKLNFLNTDPIDTYISNIKATHPSISFHHLPIITPPSPSASAASKLIEVLQLSNHHLLHYLRSSSSSIRALILDLFIGPALDVATELKLPIYIFSPINASNLSAFLYLPTLHSQSDANLVNLGDAPLHFPGLSYPIPASHLPNFFRDRDDEAGKLMLNSYSRVPTLAKGVLVNTFDALEPQALRGLEDALAMAPIYCVGPITAGGTTSKPRHESLAWLDRQPRGSVLFLSFGSMGVFLEDQIREIAVGLERSGQRFLWVVRGPPSSSRVIGGWVPWTEPNLEALMPKGFTERTRERGFLVSTWAPQVELLEHEAVGGFVTHCGWNSVLEAIVAGVAMIAWPLYAEQEMNKLFLVETGLAVDMRRDENGFVRAEEVEEKVRWLMESEGGKKLRRKVGDVGKEARVAVSDSGTSHAAMAEMLRAF